MRNSCPALLLTIANDSLEFQLNCAIPQHETLLVNLLIQIYKLVGIQIAPKALSVHFKMFLVML